MQIKFIYSTLLVSAFILSQTAYANLPPKPAKCPGTSAIASVRFDLVQRDRDSTWSAWVMANHYDTNDSWTFGLLDIEANNEDEARQKALASLKSLHFHSGPEQQNNLWICAYETDEGYKGISGTPSIGGTSQLHLLHKY